MEPYFQIFIPLNNVDFHSDHIAKRERGWVYVFVVIDDMILYATLLPFCIIGFIIIIIE